ncbi:S24 family peptidase [Megalodesulfovibrio paquesii]
MTALYQRALDWLTQHARTLGGPGALAERLNAPRATVYKVLNSHKNTNAQDFMGWLESLGAELVFPDGPVATARELRFEPPTIVSVRESEAPSGNTPHAPLSEDYLAVPLVEQAVAAGPGLIPEHTVRDWVIVWRWQEAIRGKSNLVAVRVGKAQTSMAPTIHPGDILLVDRNDIHREPHPPGNIYLVQDPAPDYGLAVKRVIFEHQNRRLRVVFYSDNAVEHPPRTYDFQAEYHGEISRALIGRVVWAWSDMTRK